MWLTPQSKGKAREERHSRCQQWTLHSSGLWPQELCVPVLLNPLWISCTGLHTAREFSEAFQSSALLLCIALLLCARLLRNFQNVTFTLDAVWELAKVWEPHWSIDAGSRLTFIFLDSRYTADSIVRDLDLQEKVWFLLTNEMGFRCKLC